MPENNSFQQQSGSYLKTHWKCNPCEATFFLLYCSLEARLLFRRHVTPGFDKFVFIKNTSKTALSDNPQAHVVGISLSRVSAWCCSLIRSVWTQLVCARAAAETASAVFVWKATVENSHFFWHLQIKRNMSYLCSSVAAKSLSPRGTKQGFVVGFSRAAQCVSVKRPKLQGARTNFLSRKTT